MANARGKQIDNTHLSIDNAEERGFIHRDYIAHCFRWSHVVKYLLQKHRYKNTTIMDIGCGKEVPLAKLLYSNKMTGATYIGVDINKLAPKFNFGKFEQNMFLYGGIDFAEDVLMREDPNRVTIKDVLNHQWVSLPRPKVITCFEVLEHVEPAHTRRILENIRSVLDPSGVAFISTPCYNGQAAANHVNEITYETLGALIQDLGFGIEGVYGTFASQRDIEPILQVRNSDFYDMYSQLKEYYDSNVLATFMAPLFPEASRNALWALTQDPQEHQDLMTFPKWEELSQPWTSSELWEQLKG